MLNKKIKIADLAMLVLLIIIFASIIHTKKYEYGDVNGDGVANVLDLAATKRAAIGYKPLSENEFKRADVNNDKIIDEKDLIILKTYLLNK